MGCLGWYKTAFWALLRNRRSVSGGEFLGVGDDFGDGPTAAAAATADVASAGDSFLVASAGSIAPSFYWQLIDTGLAAESHRADTVIL